MSLTLAFNINWAIFCILVYYIEDIQVVSSSIYYCLLFHCMLTTRSWFSFGTCLILSSIDDDDDDDFRVAIWRIWIKTYWREKLTDYHTGWCRKAGDVNNGRLCFNLNTRISSQNWLRSSSDHLEKKKNWNCLDNFWWNQNPYFGLNHVDQWWLAENFSMIFCNLLWCTFYCTE